MWVLIQNPKLVLSGAVREASASAEVSKIQNFLRRNIPDFSKEVGDMMGKSREEKIY
jgi:hypothetical protein